MFSVIGTGLACSLKEGRGCYQRYGDKMKKVCWEKENAITITSDMALCLKNRYD